MCVQPEYKLHIERIWWSPSRYYVVKFNEPGQHSDDKEVRKKVKHAFATLRKAIKVYRHSPEYYQTYHHDFDHSVAGDSWHLHKDLLPLFADWMEFTVPLETLMEQAHERAEKLRQEQNQRREADRARLHAEFGSRFSRLGARLMESDPRVNEALRLFELARTATRNDVKKRYRVLAKQYHPDTGGDPEQFKRLNQAYQVLLDWLDGAATSFLGSV